MLVADRIYPRPSYSVLWRVVRTFLRRGRRGPSWRLRGAIRTAALLGLLLPISAWPAELKPQTAAAYRKYLAGVEQRTQARDSSSTGFLWIDGKTDRWEQVRAGTILTQQIKSPSIPGGMVQDWVGAVFIPGATLAEAESVHRDYADYGKIYAPDISHPKVLSHDGNRYVVSYRITEKKFLTAVVDVVNEVRYIPLGPRKLAVWSESQSVRQVDHAGTPSEVVLPPEKGLGMLWAIDTYWRIEQRDEGAYIECEAVSFSREIPLEMDRLLAPILRSFAENSLVNTLAAKKRAIQSLPTYHSAALPSAHR